MLSEETDVLANTGNVFIVENIIVWYIIIGGGLILYINL
jgi:hypothetical protein